MEKKEIDIVTWVTFAYNNNIPITTTCIGTRFEVIPKPNNKLF